MKGECKRCANYRRGQRMRRLNRFHVFGIRMRSDHGAYLVDVAEHIIELVPRKPIIVPVRLIDKWYEEQPYNVTKRHLPHVDPDKPGIMGEIMLRNDRRPLRFVLEGHHRMERHRLERTNWSCYLLTRYETWMVAAPQCDCWKGVQT